MFDLIVDFEKCIGYIFQSWELLECVLIYFSFGEGCKIYCNYECLEFFGDWVLGLMMVEVLFNVFEGVDEGVFVFCFNLLVCKEICVDVVCVVDIGFVLKIGCLEEKGGGCDKILIFGDVCELLIVVIYLDGGCLVVQVFYD